MYSRIANAINQQWQFQPRLVSCGQIVSHGAVSTTKTSGINQGPIGGDKDCGIYCAISSPYSVCITDQSTSGIGYIGLPRNHSTGIFTTVIFDNCFNRAYQIVAHLRCCYSGCNRFAFKCYCSSSAISKSRINDIDCNHLPGTVDYCRHGSRSNAIASNCDHRRTRISRTTRNNTDSLDS